MRIVVVIATCGDEKWAELALARAVASAAPQVAANGYAAELVFRHYPGLTIAQARNRAALDVDPGSWLCFLDADDELEPGYLDAMIVAWTRGAITTDWAPLLVPAVRRVDKPTQIARSGIPQRGRWPRLNECVVGTLVRACCFREVGGFRDRTDDGTELVSLEDYDLWLRCHDAGAQLVYVEAAVYRAYVSPDGRNRDQSPYDAIWADHVARVEAA